MEEEKEIIEEVVETEGWWTRVKNWCGEHPDIVLTLLGGACSIVGGAMKLHAMKNEYQDEVYMTDGDSVYRLPAKSMNSKKLKTLK